MALDDDARALAAHPTLAALEPEALRMLAFSAETRILRAGDVLFRRDDPSDGGFFILSGAIALDIADNGGQAARILGPGTLIGDIALITKTRRPATAMAREPSSVLKITRPLFHRILNEHPRSAVRVRQVIAERLRGFTQELDEFRQRSFEAPG
jgi:CRP-like cAMP-binding protein